MASKRDEPWSRDLLGTLVYDHFIKEGLDKRDVNADPLEPIERIIFEEKKVTLQITSALKFELTGSYCSQMIRVVVIEDGQIREDENLHRSYFRLPLFTPEKFRRRNPYPFLEGSQAKK